MVPLLFLVATTTTSNSSGNGNHTQAGDLTNPSNHILPTVLVLSLLLLIIALLAWYFLRVRNQRKAVVTTVDKKIPNGILEEQGNIVMNKLEIVEKQQDRV